MSQNLYIYVFQSVAENLWSEVLDAARSLNAEFVAEPGESRPGVDTRSAVKGGIHSWFWEGSQSKVDALATQVGKATGRPWLATAILEDSIWDYVLYDRETRLDRFSVAPEYWEVEDPAFVSQRRGNAELLAASWGIPVGKIQNYVRNWGLERRDEGDFEFRLQGKAYPSDRSSYGQAHQLFDFLSALGAKDPLNLLDGALRHRTVW